MNTNAIPLRFDDAPPAPAPVRMRPPRAVITSTIPRQTPTHNDLLSNPFIDNDEIAQMPVTRPGLAYGQHIDPNEANSTNYVREQFERLRKLSKDPLWRLITSIAAHCGSEPDSFIDKEMGPAMRALRAPTGQVQPGTYQATTATQAAPTQEQVTQTVRDLAPSSFVPAPSAAAANIIISQLPTATVLPFDWIARFENSGVGHLSARLTNGIASAIAALRQTEQGRKPNFTIDRVIHTQNEVVHDQFARLTAAIIQEPKLITLSRPVSKDDMVRIKDAKSKALKELSRYYWNPAKEDFVIFDNPGKYKRTVDELYDAANF